MKLSTQDKSTMERLASIASEKGLDITNGKIRRTSSRFCLGVEHGDYNGTELFGVGTDRFIWLAYKPNDRDKIRLFSANFPEDGIVEFSPDNIPEPKTIKDSWARFPYGAAYILKKGGCDLSKGFDAVIYGNIPGGGMSRSASLAINLILTMFDVNGIDIADDFKIIDMAQGVENDYIGSPCGQLDQIMIYFAKAGMGTHYNPENKTISYVPLGKGGEDLRIVVLDTGTVRPGLEKSTYKIRRQECEQLVEMTQKAGFSISSLADIKDQSLCDNIEARFSREYPHLCKRMKYIYEAQQRFYRMLDAWKAGDVETVGKIFRTDGIGLRDDYKLSGPELETMCDIARTIPGVLGERMLGGGDKGAAGVLVKADSVDAVKQAVDAAYPRSHPDFAQQYAVHVCNIVDGIRLYDGLHW